MNKYHDRIGIYTNPALNKSSYFTYDFKNAIDKLNALEDFEAFDAGYDLKELAAKADFENVIRTALEKLEKNNQVNVVVRTTRLVEDSLTECRRIELCMYDRDYFRAQGGEFFNFYVDIWPNMLTAPFTEFDKPGYERFSFEDRKVIRVARAIYEAWKKWQYDRAYTIISGVGRADDLISLRQKIVDKARHDEYVNKFFEDRYAQVDAEITKKLYEQYANIYTAPHADLDRINKDLSQTVEDLYNTKSNLKDLYKSYYCGDNNAILETCLGGKDDE